MNNLGAQGEQSSPKKFFSPVLQGPSGGTLQTIMCRTPLKVGSKVPKPYQLTPVNVKEHQLNARILPHL